MQWDAKKKKYVRQTLGLDTLSGSMEGLKAAPAPTLAMTLAISP